MTLSENERDRLKRLIERLTDAYLVERTIRRAVMSAMHESEKDLRYQQERNIALIDENRELRSLLQERDDVEEGS